MVVLQPTKVRLVDLSIACTCLFWSKYDMQNQQNDATLNGMPPPRMPMPPTCIIMPLSPMSMPLCCMPMLPLPPMFMLPLHMSMLRAHSCLFHAALTLDCHIHIRQRRHPKKPGPTQLRETSELQALLKYKRSCFIKRFKPTLLRSRERPK